MLKSVLCKFSNRTYEIAYFCCAIQPAISLPGTNFCLPNAYGKNACRKKQLFAQIITSIYSLTGSTCDAPSFSPQALQWISAAANTSAPYPSINTSVISIVVTYTSITENLCCGSCPPCVNGWCNISGINTSCVCLPGWAGQYCDQNLVRKHLKKRKLFLGTFCLPPNFL